MPLPSPILDDRSYQQLRDELVRRIPVYTPEWTDHNASDPGITLIELFAFLGENLLYRFNQIPEATKLEFLKRLQIPLRPAVPSRAMIAFTTKEPAGVLVPLRSEAAAGRLTFETRDEVNVWPVSVRAVGRIKAEDPDKDKRPEEYEYSLRILDALKEVQEVKDPVYYQTRIVAPCGCEEPVDFSAAVDGILWIAVLKEDGCDPKKLADAALSFGFVPDPNIPEIKDVLPCPGAASSNSSNRTAMEWQISLAELKEGKPDFQRLRLLADTTSGLTQEGVVRLRLPKDISKAGDPQAATDIQGTGDLPPLLDDETSGKLLFWLRGYRLNKTLLPSTRLVIANAAEVEQCATANPEHVGTGNGQANQKYSLVHAQVLPDTLVLQVEEESGWATWSRVDDFFASGTDSRHFVLDPEAGKVAFGDGDRGRPPQIGERIRTLSYRYGGGASGNVAAKAISKVNGVSGVTVSNPRAAWGGADKEDLESALDRIPGELRRRDRAVTAQDFRELALQTPGSAVGRAECLPRFHAPTLMPEKAGVVSVVIWPKVDSLHPDAPRPDRNLLQSVCAWLDERRLITTELYVIPPAYRRVAVSIALEVKDGYGVEAVRRWVELVMRQYLAPLPPYGPSGQGWPLGRRVYGPELEAAALQVEGVQYIEQLKLAGWNEKTGQWEEPETVTLREYEVPELDQVIVVEGTAAPKAWEGIAPPKIVAPPIPIPVIRKEC
jgi:hypothetical protein